MVEVLIPKMLMEIPHYKNLSESNWEEITSRVGVEANRELPYLGHGAYACVFDIGNNKVLKVTVDDQDFYVAQYIYGKNLFGFVDIYDAFEVNGFYCTVVKKMFHLDESWQNFLDETDHIRDPVTNWMWWSDFASEEMESEYSVQLGWLELVAEECLDHNLAFGDIHSDNVMMDANGRAAITDFGSPEDSWSNYYTLEAD